ncbi:YceD family protein [Gordonia sp. DT30]|uniref:YceD family protein n=1 Tax=Gordonia sp. DT30 TaxID=3416546 RepID=UPI003CEB038B
MAENAVTPGSRSGAAPAHARGPFVLDIRSLGRRPGTMTEVHQTVRTPERLGVEMIGIPADSEVDLDLRLESVSEGVLITGTVCGETQGQCARCLEPVDGTVTVFLTELYAYPNSETEQTSDDDEVHRIVDDRVDLEQAIIDAVALELPMSPLCREDCPGLCSVCGVPLDGAESGHGHELIDPRWAGLVDKFGDLGDGTTTTSSDQGGSDDRGRTRGVQ